MIFYFISSMCRAVKRVCSGMCRHTTCCQSGGSHMPHQHCSTLVHQILSFQGLLFQLATKEFTLDEFEC